MKATWHIYWDSFFGASFLADGDGWTFSLPVATTVAGSARIVTLSSHSDVVGVEIVASALVVALAKESEFSKSASFMGVPRLSTRDH